MKIPDLVTATEKRDAAYEIKFVVPTSVAEAALVWARSHMAPDPHASNTDGDGYRVNSLYFDTPRLDVYQRNGSYGKSKYRVRRYGTESTIFLERKLKSRGLVSKRRTRIAEDELSRLARVELEPGWIGYWFRRRLVARQLEPRCQICYDRVARVGMMPEGPIRLTVDRNVRAFVTGEYQVAEMASWMPLLPDRCILELKFRQEMPPLFKSLLQALSLAPQPVSKYRLSVQAFGLAPEANAAQPAAHNGHVTADELLTNHQPVTLQPAAPAREA
ncbi:MAG: polyphosphate polymerase domain-containing protein [Verrucomicrobiota bacterium]